MPGQVLQQKLTEGGGVSASLIIALKATDTNGQTSGPGPAILPLQIGGDACGDTPTVTPTATATAPPPTPVRTPTPLPSATPTASVTETARPTITATLTANPTPTATTTLTAKPTITPTVTQPPDPTPTVMPTPPPPGVLRHFQCHNIKRKRYDPIPGIELSDQFGDTVIEVVRPRRLCAPADKNGEDESAPFDARHLVGYDIRQRGQRFKRMKGIEVENQFGTIQVEVIRPNLLLVPSAKSLVGLPHPLDRDELDHYECYHVKRARTRVAGLAVTDQFGTFTVDVKRPLRLCNPVDKNGEGILDPQGHLMCYAVRTRGRPTRANAFIDNQFGPDELRVGKPRELCVPSIKRHL